MPPKPPYFANTIAARNSRFQIFLLFWKAATLTFISGGNPVHTIDFFRGGGGGGN